MTASAQSTFALARHESGLNQSVAEDVHTPSFGARVEPPSARGLGKMAKRCGTWRKWRKVALSSKVLSL